MALSSVVHPPPLRRSLTVPLKLSVRDTLGSTSQVVLVLPAFTVDCAGNQRVPELAGETLLKRGPLVFVAAGGMAWAVPVSASICSQQ